MSHGKIAATGMEYNVTRRLGDGSYSTHGQRVQGSVWAGTNTRVFLTETRIVAALWQAVWHANTCD